MRNKTKITILAVISVVSLGGLIVGLSSLNRSNAALHDKKPTSVSEQSFLLDEIGYECSQPIEGEWVETQVGRLGEPSYYFQPADQEAFKKWCRSSYVIEYHAVLDILRREDIVTTIEKFDTTQAWVKALNASYIKDTDYIHRILPAYDTMNIHCIIVVHSPDGTRFFLEDGDEDHAYLELTDADFLASLNKAPKTDITNFWLGLH